MSKVVECKLMLLIHLTGMSVLPPLDEDHRFKTPNLHGFSDTRLNVTQRKFVRSAVQDTKDKPEGPDGKVPLALDLGGGYGDCILAIRKRGGNILYIDRSETEAAAASDRLSSLDLPPRGISDFWVGQLPAEDNELVPAVNLRRADHPYRIVHIGAFAVLMYMSGEEILQLFRWAYDVLPSGGQFFATGTSPYSNLFPGYDEEHLRQLARFKASPKQTLFPGWTPDVRAKMQAYLPDNYFSRYPNYFHLLDPEVLSYHAEQAGFIVLESRFLRKSHPERLRYRGSKKHVGELTSIILLKP